MGWWKWRIKIDQRKLNDNGLISLSHERLSGRQIKSLRIQCWPYEYHLSLSLQLFCNLFGNNRCVLQHIKHYIYPDLNQYYISCIVFVQNNNVCVFVCVYGVRVQASMCVCVRMFGVGIPTELNAPAHTSCQQYQNLFPPELSWPRCRTWKSRKEPGRSTICMWSWECNILEYMS